MDTKQQIRNKRQNIRNNIKLSLIKNGHIMPNLHIPIQNTNRQNETQKKLKQNQEQNLPVRTKRKTSWDIRSMGHTFDMFECNQIFIFNDFDEMYDLVRKIDEGSQSVVYEALQKKTKRKYAVKIIRKRDQDIIFNLKTQFRILRNLDHPNIVKAYNLFIDEKLGIHHLVLEYCQSPNLRFHMLKNHILKQTQVAQILTIILQSIAYLHSQGICHRDIKPQNIIFDPSSRNIKLIDFQISKMIKYNHQKLEMLSNTGTLYYKAPQIFNFGFYYQEVDIWAVGVICYEMIMGDFPFRSKYQSQVIRQIRQNQPRYDTSNATDLCINFMKNCLNKDPIKRFTAAQALKSPFILKYSSISTNSSPMRRKNSQQLLRNTFGLQINKCLNQDSGLKNTLSLDVDSGIRLKISNHNSP